MRHTLKNICGIYIFLLLSTFAIAQDSSIMAAHTNGRRLIKNRSFESASFSSAQNLKRYQYKGFTILVNQVGSSYEVQAYRMVQYGPRNVNSVFSSIYKSSIEFSYEFDQAQQRIVQRHFVFPPNSLTGWANPNEYVAMQSFDWGEPYPVKSCSISAPIHTLEEYGREYLEAACMPDADTSLRFAKKFIDYMVSSRL